MFSLPHSSGEQPARCSETAFLGGPAPHTNHHPLLAVSQRLASPSRVGRNRPPKHTLSTGRWGWQSQGKSVQKQTLGYYFLCLGLTQVY